MLNRRDLGILFIILGFILLISENPITVGLTKINTTNLGVLLIIGAILTFFVR